MSLKAKTENLLALAVALLLANTLGVKAQAPDSISGRSFGIGVSGGLYPYASYGYFLFLPSTLGRSYQIIPIYAVTGSSGTYAYSQTGIDTAAATVLDPINGQQSAQFTFSSPHSGSYYVTSSS